MGEAVLDIMKWGIKRISSELGFARKGTGMHE
jgi:hypothetical protein